MIYKFTSFNLEILETGDLEETDSQNSAKNSKIKENAVNSINVFEFKTFFVLVCSTSEFGPAFIKRITHYKLNNVSLVNKTRFGKESIFR